MARSRQVLKPKKVVTNFQGGGKIVWDDRKFVVEINKETDKRLRKSARIIRNSAVRNVPKDTGQLKRTIKYYKSRYPGGGYIITTGSKGKKGAYYWRFIEYGIKGGTRRRIRKGQYWSKPGTKRKLRYRSKKKGKGMGAMPYMSKALYASRNRIRAIFR